MIYYNLREYQLLKRTTPKQKGTSTKYLGKKPLFSNILWLLLVNYFAVCSSISHRYPRCCQRCFSFYEPSPVLTHKGNGTFFLNSFRITSYMSVSLFKRINPCLPTVQANIFCLLSFRVKILCLCYLQVGIFVL